MRLINEVPSEESRTIKYEFECERGPVEVYYINNGDGKDIFCLPSQINCRMGCTFCSATKLLSKVKTTNITTSEFFMMYWQILATRSFVNPVRHFSFMGSGEPFLNVENVLDFINGINSDPEYYHLNHKFTVCTSGPIHRGQDFFEHTVKHQLKLKLYWSLHQVDDKKRRTLMPSSASIEDSIAYLKHYRLTTWNPIGIHYTPMYDFNTSESDAEQLISIAQRIKAENIKLLEYNVLEPYCERSNSLSSFYYTLVAKAKEEGYPTNMIEKYSPPGRDIGASCGLFYKGLRDSRYA